MSTNGFLRRATLRNARIYRVARLRLYAFGHAADYRKLVAAGTAKSVVALTSWPLTSIQMLARPCRWVDRDAVFVFLGD
jgi:hypothetical protein